jgi:hypothetical protein
MAEITLGVSEAESIIDELARHNVSRRMKINGNFIVGFIPVLKIKESNFYATLPDKCVQVEGEPKKGGLWRVFSLREIVQREHIENRHLGALRNIVAHAIHNRDAGYSTQAILQDMINEMGGSLAGDNNTLALRLRQAVVDSPERVFAIGKYEEGFRGDGGYAYKKIQPVVLVPGTQDRSILGSFETNHTKYVSMRGGKHHSQISFDKYNQFRRKFVCEGEN